MSTHALDGGLRPALPPTLQPMALALAAPRPDRRTALLASGMIYLLIPAAFMALSRVIPEVRFKPHTKPDDTVIYRDVTLGESTSALPRGSVVAPPKGETVSMPKVDPLPGLDSQALLPTPAGLDLSQVSHTSGPSGSTTGDPNGPTTGTDANLPPGLRTSPNANQVYQMSSDAVRILHQTVPTYPAVARAVKQQGDVVVRMFIDTRGVPTSVQVEEGPNLLRAAAEAAARQWRFTPAQVNGQAVSATFLLTLKFRLQ